MIMKRKYRFTKIFLILGIIFALLLFFGVSSLTIYGESIIIFTIVFGSIGWIIDMFILRKPIIPIVLIIIYLLIGTYSVNEEIHTIRCYGCNFAPYKNIFTGKCRTICDICGHHASWYYEKNAECMDEIPGMIGDSLWEARDYGRKVTKDTIYIN